MTTENIINTVSVSDLRSMDKDTVNLFYLLTACFFVEAQF